MRGSCALHEEHEKDHRRRQWIDMKRIILYSHDTYGLGNIRRMLAIAESIQSDFSDASILLVSGSPMIHAFRLSAGIDYVKLPCLSRGASESYRPKSLGISKNRILKLRADLIRNTVLNFEPDLILVDKKPLGVSNELAPMLSELRSLAKRPKLALILRDILDKPEKTIPVWTSNRYHDVIRDIYDRVLVLGSTDVFNAVDEYAFPSSSANKTFFCGYTNRAGSLRPRLEIRQELGINGGRMVLATTGGGEDGARLTSEVLRTAEQLGSNFAEHCMVFLGPEMPERQADHFLSWGSELPSVTVKSFSNDLVSYLGAADAVVSMGGYNTVAEILSVSVPAVIVPRTRPVSEQQIRATRLDHLGLVKALNPDNLGPEELLRAVNHAVEDHQTSASGIHKMNLAALQRVSDHVRSLLNDPQRDGHARLNGGGLSRSTNGRSSPAIDGLVPLAATNS
jgi:predicted glycosyltransferase